MLTTLQLLEPLAALRTDEIVVTSMSTVRPWGRLMAARGHVQELDFASADSAMGHTADFALGIALARPDRQVLCLNGDGSTLMTLGTLATAVGSGARNFVLFVVDNGGFEITGHQPLAGSVDFAGLARASGFSSVHHFDEADRYRNALPGIVRDPGPTLVHVRVAPGNEGPISRSEGEESPYLRVSTAESVRILRRTLQRPLRAGVAGPP